MIDKSHTARDKVSKTKRKTRVTETLHRAYYGSMPWITLLDVPEPCEAWAQKSRSGTSNCLRLGYHRYTPLPRSEADAGVMCWKHLMRNMSAEPESGRVQEWLTKNPYAEWLEIRMNSSV